MKSIVCTLTESKETFSIISVSLTNFGTSAFGKAGERVKGKVAPADEP